MGETIRIAVGGARGRMGRAVTEVLDARDDLELTALFGRPAAEGSRLGGHVLTSAAAGLRGADVVIDFSSAAASVALARSAASAGGPALVIGSTGFSSAQEAVVRRAAASIAIVMSGNFSIGVTLLTALVEQASRRLAPSGWDIDVIEAHHRNKRDAPSGTALMLGESAARGRGVVRPRMRGQPTVGDRAPRGEDRISYAVIRAGGVVGEHAVMFTAEDEILTLSHSARDRRLFARGAIEAAVWVAGHAPGLYGMAQVLGLEG